MRNVIRFIAVVTASSALGILLGLLPSLLRGSTAVHGQEQPVQHNFREGFAKIQFQAAAPGKLSVRGVFRIGDPQPWDQPTMVRLFINGKDKDGNFTVKVFDDELLKSVIPAGEHSLEFPFLYSVKVPSGTYRVQVFSHAPALDEQGRETVGEPGAYEIRTVTVP